MIVKLLTEHHLEFLSFKGGCRGSSETTLVKMPHGWKSHVMAQLSLCHYASGDDDANKGYSTYLGQPGTGSRKVRQR